MAGVKLAGNRIELFLAVDRQIGALGQVLPDQAVDVHRPASLGICRLGQLAFC